MNELVSIVRRKLGKNKRTSHIPYAVGMIGGYCFDLLSRVTKKSFSISSVRVKKFCATTQFDAKKVQNLEFRPPHSLEEGLERTLQYEFLIKKQDSITFETE
jgi:nucleoside-diphosphate-sugar epimerase